MDVINIEYKIMTEASSDEVLALIENLGYKPSEDTCGDPVFMNSKGIEMRLVKPDEYRFEDELDFYLDRQTHANYVKDSQTFLCSDLTDSSDIDEEFAIETGLLERKLGAREMEEEASKDFKSISQELIKKGYKTDFYEEKVRGDEYGC